MKVVETNLRGVLIVEPDVFVDERGWFMEVFHAEHYREIGIDTAFVQDNCSSSTKGILRGLHFQKKFPQGKLVMCPHGSVYDVVVDINAESETYGEFFGIELSAENHKQLWVPPGYAHGFYVLSDMAVFHYKCTDFFRQNDEGGLIWNDLTVAIDWPSGEPIVSAKDKNWPTLLEIERW